MDYITNYMGDVGIKIIAQKFSGTPLAGMLEIISESKCKLDTYSIADWPEPADYASNGVESLRRYDLGNGAFAIVATGESTEGITLCDKNYGFRDLLGNYDCDNYDELFAEYGLAPNLAEATEGDTDVAIWVERNYYAGTLNAHRDEYLRDAENEIRIFPTYAEAEAWVETQEAEIYCTSHGEAGAPEYTICQI